MDPFPLDTSNTSSGNGHSSDGADRVSERGQYKECMARAGHLLATRSRSHNELESRLIGAGFDTDIVGAALGRLGELGLVDDETFARRWIDERAVAKGYGADKLVAELEAKGIDHDLAREAVSEIEADEAHRATSVALKLAPRVARRPLAAQASALAAMLLRRGFGEESTEAAVRAVLPPEGWD